MHRIFFVVCLLVLVTWCMPPPVAADWPTVAHDPQRTSFAPEETASISSGAQPTWYLEVPGYIPSKSHIITVNDARGGTVYAVYSKGLYALNAANGAVRWHYPTSMPPGNSPTVVNDVVYLPVLDKTIHAVNASDGSLLWQTLQAGSGFYANPLVVNNMIYIGNRDGYFYAFETQKGDLVWNYPDTNIIPQGVITQSAAINPTNDTVYYADSLGYVYALDAFTGSLLNKSQKTQADGFHVFWPVYYRGNTAQLDRLIVVGAHNFRSYPSFQANQFTTINGQQLMYAADSLQGVTQIDGTKFINWLNEQPSRRTVFSYYPASLQEAETPPILMWGNSSDTHYPPVIGPENRLWFLTPWINRQTETDTAFNAFGKGRFGGWYPGQTTFTPLPSATGGLESGDEAEALAVFSNTIFHNDGGDGVDQGSATPLSGTSDSKWTVQTFRDKWNPSLPPGEVWAQSWQYSKYGNGYLYSTSTWSNRIGHHGYQNPPVPLNNCYYFHRSNNVIAMCK